MEIAAIVARGFPWLALLAATLSLAPARSIADDAVTLSADTTVELGGVTFGDEEVLTDDRAGRVGAVPLGGFPDGADVAAYHQFVGGAQSGDQLYTVDTAMDLGGGLVAERGDVVRFDGTTDTIEFDGSAEGIPDGVMVDAVSIHSAGGLLLSFDTTVDLGAVIADDEDVVQFDGANAFSVFFDGSGEGVASGLDLDGVHFRPTDAVLFVSFDGSGSVGGVSFDDEDILGFDASGPAWTLQYDGSVLHTALAAADVDAVPEPGQLVQLAFGILGLSLLYRRRMRNRRPSGRLHHH